MQTLEQKGRYKYSPEQLHNFISDVRRDGFCILPGHFEPEKLAHWNENFLALLNKRMADGTASGRGPARYYVSLPFSAPYADPAIYEDEDILYIIEQLGGNDVVMPELATDTPLRGSEYQVVHRDHVQRSPHMPELDPAEPFQFAVNFPLCDVTAENGPLEIARGTHLLTEDEAREQIRSGEAERQLEPLFMKVGDVMIRDVRALHRGTPNHTDEPRVMVVVGYNRAQHLRPQLKIVIPEVEYAKLSERAKRLVRVNPRVDDLDKVEIKEEYSNLYFLDEGESSTNAQ